MKSAIEKTTFGLFGSLLALASCAPAGPIASAAPIAAARAAPMTWADLKARPRQKPDKSFRYGPDPYQVVDLWRPAGPGPHPVVLMVHGGCWTSAIADRTLMDWAAADLRARGIAVWNIDYRGVDRLKPSASSTFDIATIFGVAPIFNDIVAAGDLLRAHAATEGLDVTRVVGMGHSAGGHLALWLAAWPSIYFKSTMDPTGPNPLKLAHVVSLGGLPDLEQAYTETQGCGRAPVAALISRPLLTGPTVGDLSDAAFRGRLMAGTSIPSNAPLGVPQTLINGDADKIIPTRFAIDYAAKMRAAGDEVTVTIVPEQGHVELIAPGTPAWAAAVTAIEGALGQ